MNSQITEIMKLEITGKRKKGRLKKSWEEGLRIWLEKRGWKQLREMARAN